MLKKVIFSFLLFILIGSIIIMKPPPLGDEIIRPKKRVLDQVKLIGWTAYWDEKNTLNSLSTVVQNLDVFSPILYRIEKDGSLGRLNVLYRKDFLLLSREHNLIVSPVIGDDFDFKRVSLLLRNSQVQERFISQLIEEAKKEDFAGWDIDIESLKKEDHQAFSKFIDKVANKLHENNLKLSVVIFGRTGRDNNEASLAQDYQALGKVADELRIMMYGASDEDTDPGGQAPLSWIRQVLRYTIKLVPKEKIVVGLSTHGYDWAGGSAEPLTYQQIQKRIKEASSSVSFDQKISSSYTSYQKGASNHVIWFEDAKSISQKMEMILNEFDISKFALWRIGAEDPKLWSVIDK